MNTSKNPNFSWGEPKEDSEGISVTISAFCSHSHPFFKGAAMGNIFKRVRDIASATRNEPHGCCHHPSRFNLILVVALLIFTRPLSAFASGTVLPQPLPPLYTGGIVTYHAISAFGGGPWLEPPQITPEAACGLILDQAVGLKYINPHTVTTTITFTLWVSLSRYESISVPGAECIATWEYKNTDPTWTGTWTGSLGAMQTGAKCPDGYQWNGNATSFTADYCIRLPQPPRCPANSTGIPADNPTTCICNDPYVPDPTATSCVLEQYTLSLQITPGQVEPSGSATVIATVNDAQGQPKSGAQVSIEVNVEEKSGGHDHHDATRPKGPLSGGGSTGADGTVSFTFGAPEVSGTHTFTANCVSPDCSNDPVTAKIKVMVEGLAPIPADPTLYTLIGAVTGKYSDNHYLTGNALNQLLVLAINYHFLYPNESVLHLNDASLIWGGKFDIAGNWTGDHAGHRRGTVIDIRANTVSGAIPESLFTDFEELAAGTKKKLADGMTSAEAQLHCSVGFDHANNCAGDPNRHYHVILLGVDQ